MHRSNPSTSQHGIDGLRDHRHIGSDNVAFLHSPNQEIPGKTTHLPEKFAIRDSKVLVAMFMGIIQFINDSRAVFPLDPHELTVSQA